VRGLTSRFLKTHRASVLGSLLFSVGFVYACGGPAPLTVDMPLHLEEHLDAVTIVGSDVPQNLPEPIVWDFSEPQPDWIAPQHFNPTIPALILEQTDDALRVTFDERHTDPRPSSSSLLHGDIYVNLPDLRREEWSHVLIRARASAGMRNFNICFNLNDPESARDLSLGMNEFCGDNLPIIDDGTIQTYRMRADWHRTPGEWQGPWRQLVHTINAEQPSSLDILSVTLVPKATVYAERRVGVRIEQRGTATEAPNEAPYHRSLYMHAPGKAAYRVRVPKSGRLDVGLGVLNGDVPVTSAITVTSANGHVDTLLEETLGDPDYWGQRSVDMSHLEGHTVTLAMEAEAERPGTVTLWSVPTLSGTRTTDKPNVIFYIIDGGGADYMSVYGYNRRTTPNLERIAAEGAIFDRAYSNSSWTRPSTASFLTSLQHSVLGGLRNGSNPVPDEALTMAEHMRRAGYQTAEFSSNSNAGRVSNLDRGNDFFRDFNIGNQSASSVSLHENFWEWRKAYPGEPYWVHFQTTDVHTGHNPVPPFAGLFIDPDRRRVADESWDRSELGARRSGDVGFLEAFMALDLDHVGIYMAERDLHDETMAHQDHQLGQLVARLKAAGEWERTLLIVASDHSVAAGAWDYSLLMRDPLPTTHIAYDDPAIPMLRSGVSRVPMIVVWPGHIAGRQRFSEPVSMIDLLPTILDLLDLPRPEVMQGQSLAPLLLGQPGWDPRPVILDEFEVDGITGEFRGKIEVIDGRWGASLQINPDPEDPPEWQRPVPLLLYDLWTDPECLHSLHEERPDLVEKYKAFLEAQFEAHLALGKLFTPGDATPLTPEQLETLRTLGYIQ